MIGFLLLIGLTGYNGDSESELVPLSVKSKDLIETQIRAGSLKVISLVY